MKNTILLSLLTIHFSPNLQANDYGEPLRSNRSIIRGDGRWEPGYPVYLSHIKGGIVGSFTETGEFSFTPGSLHDCSHRKLGLASLRDLFKCDVSGAEAHVTFGPAERVFQFQRLYVYYRLKPASSSQEGREWVRSYTFTGTEITKSPTGPKSNKVTLELVRPYLSEGGVGGKLSLIDLGLKGAIKGREIDPD